MINLPTIEELVRHRIEHYAQRLAEARSIAERAFCRGELYSAKQYLKTILN
jgi:hypothetical protein